MNKLYTLNFEVKVMSEKPYKIMHSKQETCIKFSNEENAENFYNWIDGINTKINPRIMEDKLSVCLGSRGVHVMIISYLNKIYPNFSPEQEIE